MFECLFIITGGVKRADSQHRPTMNPVSMHPTLPIASRQHRDKHNIINKDKLLITDTNDMGLTVTANPMAFALEKKETMKV